jgi:hypothetical protein
LVEVAVLIPAGQLLDGMQKVSTVECPGSKVILYHWSLAHEHDTTLIVVLVVSPASTPSNSVDVDHGIPPFEHLVVIQLASTG